MAFYRTFPFSAPQPRSLPSPSIEGRRLRKLHLRLSTVAVADTKIADSNSIPLSATPRSSARPFHCISVSKLFALNSPRLIPTPLLRQGVGRVPSTGRSATFTCNSDLSMTVCSSPNSNVRGRHTCITFLPPTGESAAYIPRPRLHFIKRLRH